MFNSRKKRSSKNVNPPVGNDFNESLCSKIPREYTRQSDSLASYIPHRSNIVQNQSYENVESVSSQTDCQLHLEGQRIDKRRSVAMPKIPQDIIEFLEEPQSIIHSSGDRLEDILRMPQLFKDDVSKENTSDISSCKYSGSAKSKLSEMTEEISKSAQKHKKGPNDICDLKALTRTIKQSSEFVFCYLSWAVPKWSEFYTPYCLRIVPYELIDKDDFLTISTCGVTHHMEGSTYFTPLSEWEKNYDLYLNIMKIKSFRVFRLWKGFYVWHKNITWCKFLSARSSLAKSLLTLSPILGKALLDIMNLCSTMNRVSFLDLSVAEGISLHSFWNNQESMKKKVQIRLSEFHVSVKELVNKACHDLLFSFGYTPDDANLRVPSALVGTITMRGIKTSRDGRYRMTYADQTLKKRTCVRIASFIQLVDFLIHCLFHVMVKTSLFTLKDVLKAHLQYLPAEEKILAANTRITLEEPRLQSPKCPMFIINVVATANEVKLEPSSEQFLSFFKELMISLEETVTTIPVFLSDFFFDPFTEPMICGKQEERICGLGPVLGNVINGDPEIQEIKEEVVFYLNLNFHLLNIYIEHFASIHKFYIEDINLEKKVIAEETDLEGLRGWLSRYYSEKEEIENIVDTQSLGIFLVQIGEYKKSILPVPLALLNLVQLTLPRIGKDRIFALTREGDEAYEYLIVEPKTTIGFVQYLDFLERVSIRCVERHPTGLISEVKVLNFKTRHFKCLQDQDIDNYTILLLKTHNQDTVYRVQQRTATTLDRRKEVDEMDVELEYCKDLYDLIEEYTIAVSPDEIDAYYNLGDILTTLHNLVDRLNSEREKIVNNFSNQLSKDISELFEEVANIKEEAQQSWLTEIESNPEVVKTSLVQLHEQLCDCQIKAAQYKAYQKSFKVEVTRFDILDEVVSDVKLRQLLWDSVEMWAKYVDEWTNSDFSTLIPEELNQTTAKFMKYIIQFEKGLPENLIVPKLRENVECMKDKLPVITTLRNPNLKPRHWLLVEKVLSTKFIAEERITLKLLEELDVLKYQAQLQEISGQASSEAGLEALLLKVEESWKTLEFIVLPHKDAKDIYILGSLEDIQTILDESSININTIASSKHVGPIKPRVEDWIKQLEHFSKTLDEWVACQTNWLYLEAIFSAPDIQRQLPLESKMFLQVDKSWKEIMRRTAKNPLAMPACTCPGLLEILQNNNTLLEQILKCLEAYLELKRVVFPRFYFLSNEELLEILAQTRNPFAVQSHLRKCFDAIAKLEFGRKFVSPEELTDEKAPTPEALLTTDIIAMLSPENERVLLGKNLKARGNVEDWLGKVEDSMFYSLRRQMKDALHDYVIKKRTSWILCHPSQIILTVSQIIWCQNVHRMLETESVDKAKKFEEQCYSDLNELAAMVRGELPVLQRSILCSLITIDVHARDIVTSLIQENICDSNNFEWLRQLRYYWQEDIDNCVACMANARYVYGYEYLGASPRLVITPLTDKCFLCLMGALQLDLGGAPAGPAGTGKTETTKDLAKSLAIQCVVFNCSEGLDYKMMGRFFSGLAQSGAWCCFDEFNRIDIEVLSVIAQQLITIRNAKLCKASRFMFEGREIKLVMTCATFITMNPGYAGRTELPDNLKSLFRPMAMMVPDYALIAEVILYSEGFESSRLLAQKMVNMYKLCSEQLSQQDHYDFGMRAVKSVLVMAGTVKRENPDKSEDVVLICALKDSNIPKFLREDVDLFQGILNDLFPGISLPDKDYGVIREAIHIVLLNSVLQPENCTFVKVIQLLETMIVRHGVMTVGPTGGGKTTVINTLKHTLIKLYADGVEGPYYRPVNTYTLNPKSVTLGELYGEVNPLTLEWHDGLLGIFVRLAVQTTAEEHQWIICDGPVDAVWIENMNTVLDDNKMLCLANSERIKLTQWVRMLFEVQDLEQASPATVSRCGMVYIDPEDLKWLPYVRSWLQHLPSVSPIQAEYIPFIDGLFVGHVQSGLDLIKKHCTFAIHQVDIGKVMMMCSLMQILLCEPGMIEKTMDRNRARSIICQAFVFSYIWSVGGNLLDHHREKFEAFVSDQFGEHPDAHLPSGFELWELYLNSQQRRLEPWTQIIPTFIYNRDIPFFDILVPTMDSVRFGYIMEKLISIKHPVLFTGITGVGKSVVAHAVLNQLWLSGKWVTITINFSAQTSSSRTQEILESKLEKRKKTLLGAPTGKTVVVFVDDVNMPKLEVYGAQPPIELLRQYLDFKGLYDREKMFWKEIQDVVISAACAPPGGGRNPLTPRFVRHFAMLFIPSPSEGTLKVIFKSILCSFLSDFSKEISELTEPLVNAAVELYRRISEELLPIPAKSHYIFNLRDLSKCVQGLLQADSGTMRESAEMLRLFYHECLRIFHDRLVNIEDKTYFYCVLCEICQRSFGTPVIDLPDAIQINDFPVLLFGDFMSQTSKENRIYEEIKNIDKLKTVLQDYLVDFNLLTSKGMKLIFFMDAIEHICRLARLLRSERGNGLLVGVGGMGKQSITKLGAHLNGYICFQIQLTRTYDYNSFHDDLRQLYFSAGALKQDTVFLFTDTQIVMEEFLEDVNNILNSGEVPNLFESDEYEKVIIACRPAAKEAGIAENNRDGIFDYFISQVRSKLHLVICMSPVGDAFRWRCRMFPALVNCCIIDWFVEWPEEALLSVAQDSLQELENVDLIDNIASMCYTIHQSVGDMTVRYFEEMRRHYYVTPSSYLELLKLYLNLLSNKRDQTTQIRNRIKNGLYKLHETNELVVTMREQLIVLEPQLKVKSEATAVLMKSLVKEKAQADEVRQVVASDETTAKSKAEVVQALADEANYELSLALPALEAASKALDALNKSDINELRVFNKPPNLVKFVMEAVCLLLGTKGDWASAKIVLGDVNFLKRLQEYDKENIPDSVLKKLRDYLDYPEFVPDIVATQSKVCKSMCMWVRAIDSYAKVFRIVAPKKAKVAAAEKEVAEVMAVLRQKQQKLAEVEAQIAKLEATYDASVAEKAELEATMLQCSQRLNRAGRLTMALEDEQVRWEQSVEILGAELTNMTGNVLVAAACVAYLGAFTNIYREELIHHWINELNKLKIPSSSIFSLIEVLADPYEIRVWNTCGLPRDSVSTENAILVTQAARWPLMIDPQEQASRWIRKMEAEKSLQLVKMTDAKFVRILERSIRIGFPVLLEGIGETLDPILGPVLQKQTFVQGGQTLIHFGDADIEYDANFRLYMTTKLANPHYLPEVCIQVTLVNFTVTPSGLEDQLLADAVSLERPDLEKQRSELIVRINNDKSQLKTIEDKILKLLFASKGNILDDEELIETLNESKETSAIIGSRLLEAESTEEKISDAREKYRIVATRGSCLYFVVAELANIDPMYQFSLKYFTQVFNNVIITSPPSPDLTLRLQCLLDQITLAVYTSVSRGLFEKHKLVFSFMLCISIYKQAGIISESQWNFLLRGPLGNFSKIPKKPDVGILTETQWIAINYLAEKYPAFHHLPDYAFTKISITVGDFKLVIDLNPASHKVSPVNWTDKLNDFERVMLLKALKEEKLVFAITEYIKTQLGKMFIETPVISLHALYQDTTNVTPLVFVLSSGSDPTAAFQRFALETGNRDRIQSISLGQGQGPIAEKMIDVGAKRGDWIFLQNCHLASSWMLAMERVILQLQDNPRDVHPDFRLYLSSMPSKQFPVSVLQNSVKVTNEPPKGLRANMKRAFLDIKQDYFEEHVFNGKWKKMIFGLCIFHAVIQERKKFGPLGWNILYEFNDSDRECALLNLQLFCQDRTHIPWDALEYLTGEITYGGRVTDSWDQRTLNTILKRFFSAVSLEDGYIYSPSGIYYCPDYATLAEYRDFIEALPLIEEPEIFGLHENANISFQIKETASILKTIREVQPQESARIVGKSNDEIVYELADMIVEKVLTQINKDEARTVLFKSDSKGRQPSLTTVLFQEIDRFNKLLHVIHSSMANLRRAVKGLLVMSDALEDVYNAFLNNQVPKIWASCAYPSLKNLGNWTKDLQLRLDFIQIWLRFGEPVSFWLSGFYFPQGFMTGILQTHSRKHNLPIDELKVDFKVTQIYLDQELIEQIHKTEEKEVEEAYNGLITPDSGVFLHGLFLDAAGFDSENGLLKDALPGEMNPPLPVVHLMPVLSLDTTHPRYQAPLYKTSVRAGTLSTTGHSTNFIITVLLPTDKPQSHWILRGTALLTQCE